MLEYLPLEYLSTGSQTRCVLLLICLSVLFTVNHTLTQVTAEHADLTIFLQRTLRLLRLCLTDRRTVYPLLSVNNSTGLLHCISALRSTVVMQVTFLLLTGIY